MLMNIMNTHHHLKRSFLPRSARVRRFSQYEASSHIPEHILSKSSCSYPHISPLPPPHFYFNTIKYNGLFKFIYIYLHIYNFIYLYVQSAPLICMASGPMLRYAINRPMHYDGVRVMICFLMQYTFYNLLYLRKNLYLISKSKK